MLRFARYSWKGREGAENGSYATYVESQNRQSGIGDREKMPRMPRIFDVKLIRTDDGPRWGTGSLAGVLVGPSFEKWLRICFIVKRVWFQILLIAFHLAAAFGFSVE